jgi:hypothetical protein
VDRGQRCGDRHVVEQTLASNFVDGLVVSVAEQDGGRGRSAVLAGDRSLPARPVVGDQRSGGRSVRPRVGTAVEV